MSTKVTANFESQDYAEAALVRLNELGINPQSYDIGVQGREETVHRSYPLVGGAWETSGTNAVSTTPILTTAYTTGVDYTGDYTPETNKSCLLSVLVPDEDALRARSALTSLHGLEVTAERMADNG